MSDQISPPTTAAINPELFSENNIFGHSRMIIVILLALFILLGFGLRLWNLGTESLGEDELNKLQTVVEYRTEGLSGRNGEHPFLMKGLQTVSIISAEKWNNSFAVQYPELNISEEAALRFPTVLFGSFTVLLLYLLFTEFFGSTVGLITGALWAVTPAAIGFDRIAKEDSFLLFFFLLANVFWIRSQTVAEKGKTDPSPYYWAAAAAFGAMLASKYLLHLFAISVAYYEILQPITSVKWRLGKIRWLKFFAAMGAAFLVCNPTILLPGTWHQMLTFSSEQRIGHDAYEFMGQLYHNQLTLWLKGVPWTFYYIFIAVKTPLLIFIAFLIGLIMMWRRKMGDGRYFVFFWTFMWFMPFSVLGGKFTRYFTTAQPLVLLFAAVGICFTAQWLAKLLSKYFHSAHLLPVFQAVLFAVVLLSSLFASLSVAPHYRLYTNELGGGMTWAGYYFPHDEFYDTGSRQALSEIVKRASAGASVAGETPYLMEYYAQNLGRSDLHFISLSDKDQLQTLKNGDFIVAAEGRRYFSNDSYLDYLKSSAVPFAEIRINDIISVRLYQLDEVSLSKIQSLAQ